MLIIAILLFVLSATFGLMMLYGHLNNKVFPKAYPFIHGGLNTTALVLVIAYLMQGHASPLLTTALVLLIGAASGGLTVLMLKRKQKPIPKALLIAHPMVGLLGVISLIVLVLRG
jgi:FtsH-binding integral membrane protein